MADNNKLSIFQKTGVFRFENANAVFVDPVRVMNRYYTRFKASPSAYYSRFFESSNSKSQISRVSENSKKRKRKDKKSTPLNEKEKIADQRHREARVFLLKAHEALLENTDILETLRGDETCEEPSIEQSFVELGSVWQAPLYEITLNFYQDDSLSQESHNGGTSNIQFCEPRVVLLFNNLVTNETSNDAEAVFLNNKYILPKESSFFMDICDRIISCIFCTISHSDLVNPDTGWILLLILGVDCHLLLSVQVLSSLLVPYKDEVKLRDTMTRSQLLNIAPPNSACGFNLIVVDPPWENSSARQKLKYHTLPNRFFLSLPIKQLSHTRGALVALWVTNREKLRAFVEKELFPKWGVKYMATIYWLKVKADGTLIGDLDLFHHRPYECLLLGYCYREDVDSDRFSGLKPIPDNQVFISVPGDYSRKPPIGELLMEYAPGLKPAHCIELFSREMLAGWTSWGNEPLHFQASRYFK